MKKLFFIMFLFPIFLKAQIYKAGDLLPYYYDINPDTLISYVGCHQCISTETSSINMFGIAPVDFEIVSYSSNGIGGGNENITIRPKHSNVFVIHGRKDSVYANPWSTPFWWISNVAKPLMPGDTLNKTNYSWSNLVLYLIQKDWVAVNYKNVTDFVSINDKFIGVKYQTSSDTIYGWIRVQCPDRYKCYVKDFSAGLNCTSAPSLTTSSTSTLMCLGESATLQVSGANTYSWSTGQNSSNVIVTPTTTTAYTVNGTTAFGCQLNSIITQSVDACIGIKEHDKNSTLTLYPNPTNNKVEIILNAFQTDLKIKIVNGLGQVVLEQKITNSNKFSLDVSNYTNGIYFVEVENNQGIARAKFIKN